MTTVRLLMLAAFVTLAAKAQTNAITICDQQTTGHCINLKAANLVVSDIEFTFSSTEIQPSINNTVALGDSTHTLAASWFRGVSAFDGINLSVLGPSSVVTQAGIFSTGVNSPLVTTTGTELKLEETGDTFGTTRLYLHNRFGENGLVVENGSLNLIDLMLKTTGYTRYIRLEGRSGTTHLSAPYLAIGGPNPSSPTLKVDNNSAEFDNGPIFVNSGGIYFPDSTFQTSAGITPSFSGTLTGAITFSSLVTMEGSSYVNYSNSGSVLFSASAWLPTNANTVALGDASHRFDKSYFSEIVFSNGTNTTDVSGTGVTAPALITGALAASGSVLFSGITGSTQCLHVNSSGLLSGTSGDCISSSFSGTFSNAISFGSLVTMTGNAYVNYSNSGQVLFGGTEWAPFNTNTVALGDASHQFATSYFRQLVVYDGSSSTSTVSGTGVTTPVLAAGLVFAGITGSTQCVASSSSGLLFGTGSSCLTPSFSGTMSGGITFSSSISFSSTVTMTGAAYVNYSNGGQVLFGSIEWQPFNANTVGLGDASHQFAKSYIREVVLYDGTNSTDLSASGLVTPAIIVSGAIVGPGGVGQSATITVAAPGGGTCTLIFGGGLKTGGTC